MIRHAVFFLAYDQVPEQHMLTVQALETVLAQDIGPLDILLIDNGSTIPETYQHFLDIKDLYIEEGSPSRIQVVRYKANASPLIVSNRAASYIWSLGHDKFLQIPNDVMIPTNLYSEFNKWPRGIVTGSMTDAKDYPRFEEAHAVSENTPMAVALMRKWAHDALIAKDGYMLDENFFFYASDCDFALRLAACRISGVQLDLQYWHHCSAHWRLLPPDQQQEVCTQADRDREYFQQKWGCRVDDPAYGEMAVDLQFKGVGKL